MKHKPTTEHNHLKRLLELQAQGKLPRQAGLFEIDVVHDDWCDMLQGKGYCNCNPEFRQRPAATDN